MAKKRTWKEKMTFSAELEFAVIHLLLSGKSVREVGAMLQKTPNTVQKIRMNWPLFFWQETYLRRVGRCLPTPHKK